MFIIINFKYNTFNYPKYLVILKCNNSIYLANSSNINFYYLVVPNFVFYDKVSCIFPTYLIFLELYFKGGEKFDLSKLGTDYILNDICHHNPKECKGSYPENHVFVNEPLCPF